LSAGIGNGLPRGRAWKDTHGKKARRDDS